MPRPQDVLTDIPGQTGRFWGDHSTYVGPDRPPTWLIRLVGDRWAWNLIGVLVALRLFARRRHCQGVVTEGGISGQAFAWLQALVPWGRKPHVMIDCNWYLPASPLRRLLQRWRLWLAARSVERFVVWASHEVADYAAAFDLPADKLEYVPFHTTLHDYQFTVRDDGYLFAGGNYDRDYRTLVEAVRPLAVPTWIATTRAEALLNDVSIPPQVRVEGTTVDGFRQAMAAARLVVVPMQAGLLHSGGQQTCLNAMLLGKPTIAIGRKWAVDFIDDGVNGLIVDYEDPQSLRSAIEWVIAHPAEARTMAERGRATAARFTTERTMRSVHEIVTLKPETALMSSLLEMPRISGRIGEATKRLLVVARWPIGGIRTHLLYNFPALAAAGYHCTFVGPDNTLDPLRDALPEAEFVGVPVHGAKCALWRTTRQLLRGGGYDLLHSHGLTAACHSEAARFGLGVHHVATLHEPLRPERFNGLLGPIKRWTMARVLGRIDTLITVSEDARANLVEFMPRLARSGNVATIPNGIDTARYAGGRGGDALRRELGIDAETILVGYLGRFMREKGFPLLLEALIGLSQTPGLPAYHLVGFGSGDNRREYQKQIDAANLTTRVTLRDFVPDVAPVLRQLDLVVVPSLWEASPLVPMEALSAGVPVLGANCPGLREVLSGTPSRTFRTGDADALRHVLRGVLESPWTEAAAEYAETARERFDNTRSGQRLVEIYEGLLKQTQRRAA